ncbi:MAG: argininosuccinate lyase [Rhodospirillales bacterium]|jgi:argininosuccinate lyase|tara:strand:+ start:425 stop:1834 length:1410 start_codon:yes stop_codon:yes gene_type:complete
MSDQSKSSGTDASAMWGGRFSGGPNDIMEEINASIGFDQRFFAQDIRASKAHAEMLGAQNIITPEDAKSICEGLDQVYGEIETGTFTFKRSLEDIHMNVEARLKEIIGEPGGRLHTGRSRNDQVANDFKLWVRDAIDQMDVAMQAMQEALIDQAEAHSDSAMPGFTHMQIAQPVTLGHHLLAYVEMLGRDRSRLIDGRKRMNECVLGAAALAGTSFPIDRHMTAKALGFDRPSANSLDSVADRDYVLEYLSTLSITSVHLSRLAEEYVLWCSVQFGYARLGDSFSTGSSIMPQKRNPDAAELIRAKSGRVIGSLNALLIVMKGLPMTYGKDMQEDKEPIFDAHDTVMLSLAAMTGMLSDTTFNKERMAADAGKGFSTATDLADWLVRVLGMPFRDAHHVTGAVVKMAEDKGLGLDDLTLDDLQSKEPRIMNAVFEILSVDNSLKSRISVGGTAPSNVVSACAEARKRFL